MHVPTRKLTLRSCLLFVLAVTVMGCSDDGAASDPRVAEGEQALTCPTIPPSLAVPEGNRLSFVLSARGVQIYVCKVGSTGSYDWTFQEPEADLYGLFGFRVGYHYAGPTWEALDGSTVVGARVASYSADPTAIPWLLLQATSHTGKGAMSRVSYIQRLKTVGGLTPEGGCSEAQAGELAEVPYTALYAFYR